MTNRITLTFTPTYPALEADFDSAADAPVSSFSVTFQAAVQGDQGIQGARGEQGASGLGGVSALPAGVTSDLYEYEIIGTDGRHIIGERKNTLVADAPSSKGAIFAEQHEYGVAVTLDAAVDAYSSLAAYAGPLVDTALWISDPAVETSGYSAAVSYDRTEVPQATGDEITFTTGSIDIPAALASDAIGIAVMYGQSFATRIGTHAERITTAAVDPGNALMPGFTGNNPSPYVGRRTFANTFVDLMEGDGESVCSGFGAKLESLMDARGSKVPTVASATGWGGTEFFKLLQHNAGIADPNDAVYYRIPYWSEYTRTWHQCRLIASDVYSKTPIALPPVMVSEGYAETTYPVTTGDDFRYWIERWRDKINAFLRKEYRWHPSAPDLPCIMTVLARPSSNMYSGTTRILSFDTDGPTLGHWKAYKKSKGIVMAGPDYFLPPYSDNTHPSPTGMYYLGEMIARAMFETIWGRGFFPVAPLAFTRDSATQITIQLQMMAGSAAIDTTTVTDFAAGDDIKKGFLLWRADTGAVVPISNVAVSGTTVILTIPSGYTSVELVCDYAVWRNLSTGVNFGNVAGARGCIRSSQAYPTTLAGGVDQYDWMIPFREKIPASAGYTSRVR